jgi:hypothetical protein
MPFPTVVGIAFASGIAAALASRVELKVSPRPAMLTRSFIAYMIFVAIVLVPISAYFFVFHGDWFLLYYIDVRRVPSAIALVAFVAEAGVGALGFGLGAALVRSQRDGIAIAALLLAVVASGVIVVIEPDRLMRVGSYVQYHRNFGLSDYGGPLLQGTIAMAVLLLLGLVLLLARLHAAGRRLG